MSSDSQIGKKQGKIRIERELEIINSAQEEFILHGYKGATVRGIAERAGLPTANVMYYFKNKENIYHAVLEQTMNMWNQAIDDIKQEDGAKVAIEKYVAAKVRMSFEHPAASKIFAMEIIQGGQNLNEYARTYQRQWIREKTKLFKHWIANGEMADIDPVNLFFLIWASTQHYADFNTQILIIMNRADYEEEDIAHVSKFLTDFILRGCGIK